MFGKSTRGEDMLNWKEANTLQHELLMVECSKNAAVQESVDGYERSSRPIPRHFRSSLNS